jgi:hypothetical protein
VAFRCAGQAEIGPKLVFDQFSARTSAPISPPPNGNSSSRLLREVLGLIVFIVSLISVFSAGDGTRLLPRRAWTQSDLTYFGYLLVPVSFDRLGATPGKDLGPRSTL